jgi:hypothetical protein
MTAPYPPTLVPRSVLASIQPCVGPRRFTIHGANIVVDARTHGTTLTLHITLLAKETTSAEPIVPGDPLRAFVRIDTMDVLLGLRPREPMAFSVGSLARGRHALVFGVFANEKLINGGTLCLRV